MTDHSAQGTMTAQTLKLTIGGKSINLIGGLAWFASAEAFSLKEDREDLLAMAPPGSNSFVRIAPTREGGRHLTGVGFAERDDDGWPYSLAACLATTRPAPWCGVWKLGEGKVYYIAVNHGGEILPDGDQIGDEQDVGLVAERHRVAFTGLVEHELTDADIEEAFDAWASKTAMQSLAKVNMFDALKDRLQVALAKGKGAGKKSSKKSKSGEGSAGLDGAVGAMGAMGAVGAANDASGSAGGNTVDADAVAINKAAKEKRQLAILSIVGGVVVLGAVGGYLVYDHLEQKKLEEQRRRAAAIPPPVTAPWTQVSKPSFALDTCGYAWSMQEIRQKGWALSKWTCTPEYQAGTLKIEKKWMIDGGQSVDAPGKISADGRSSEEVVSEKVVWFARGVRQVHQVYKEDDALRLTHTMGQAYGLNMTVSPKAPTTAEFSNLPFKVSLPAPPWEYGLGEVLDQLSGVSVTKVEVSGASGWELDAGMFFLNEGASLPATLIENPEVDPAPAQNASPGSTPSPMGPTAAVLAR